MTNFLRYFFLRPKSSPILKNVLFFRRPAPVPQRKCFRKGFDRLWAAMEPHRIGFKPFDFYSYFLSLPPYPFPTHNTYFRQQSRTFVFWYEFSARKYNITLDFGLKQKKTLTETVLWARKTRRHGRTPTAWWSYIRRNSSYRFSTVSVFRLNNNGNHPLFPVSDYSPYRWFEESLPLFRRYGRNFHSRLTTYRSDKAILSQSLFDHRTLLRRAPLDASTLWLASPLHDYSVFLKDYSINKSIVLPERYFQFRQRLQYRRSYWTALLFRFWDQTSKVATVFPLTFASLSFSFYFKLRLWEKIKASFSGSHFFLEWNLNQRVAASGYGWSSACWMPLVLPSASRRRTPLLHYKKVAFFVKRMFFYRHLHQPLAKFQRTLVTTLSIRNDLLRTLWTKLFQQNAFNGPLLESQLLSLWSALTARRFLRFSVKILAPRRLSNPSRRPLARQPRGNRF